MSSVLTELGIKDEVQFFFQDNFTVDANGMLTFDYGQHTELFGREFHRVPVTDQVWMAGDQTLNHVRTIVVCSSAIDAITFLSVNLASYQRIEQVLFISVGLMVRQSHIELIRSISNRRKICLVMPRHVIGCVADIKLATAIRGHESVIRRSINNVINIEFRNQSYSFGSDELSLSAFEKKTKFRSHIRTYKPRHVISFLNLAQSEY
ncbi:hypothetical protein [Pedobacter sp. MC2016-24]|uniref:hypothetical protein n=1 Tax=Pedobacter sp. MC2016-24 TaxID=2780090 RepID=UPI00187F60AD|nr:hypothetical protein [Pedobacter sp. MC2016-24]MBE9599910.1 hypothetical protein [Pedobacter sp. MC2016-24]